MGAEENCFCKADWKKFDTTTTKGRIKWTAVATAAVHKLSSWARELPHFCAQLSVIPLLESGKESNVVTRKLEKGRVYYFSIIVGNHTRTLPVEFFFGVHEDEGGNMRSIHSHQVSKYSTFD